MKPSEWLISKGWKPVKSDVHPQETMWRKGDKELRFLDAFLEQERQDKESETK